MRCFSSDWRVVSRLLLDIDEISSFGFKKNAFVQGTPCTPERRIEFFDIGVQSFSFVRRAVTCLGLTLLSRQDSQ